MAGEVTGGSNVGGVVGYCLGKLENVINAANVNGTSNVGGVIGYYGSKDNASYNLGNTDTVSGGSDSTVGGVIGKNQSSLYLYNSYSTTQRLCGMSDSNAYENCFDTSGNSVIASRDEAAFKNGEVAYLLHNGKSGQTWGQNIGTDDAPNCLNNSPQVFRGTNGEYHNHTGESCDKCSATPPLDTNGVYQISTAQQLFGLAKLIQTAHGVSNAQAVLTTDIVVTDPWTPICNYRYDFQGALDRQGHSITFLGNVGSVKTQYHDNCTGLFAEIGNSAVVQNLTVIGNFTATSDKVGAIVGSNSGTVKNCRVINSMVSNNGGALVGRNNGTIQNCYSLVQDRPLAGYNAGKIINSYYLGSNTADTTAATSEQFKSGEIARKLAAGNAESDTLKWGQKIGTDSCPVLGGATVYYAEDCYHNHNGNGTCAVCNDPNKPTKNNDTYQIANNQNLLWFAKLVNGTLLQGMPAKPAANAVLTADITVDTSWSGIGTGVSYSGSFNGDGYTVTVTNAAQMTLLGETSTNAKLNAICVKGGHLTQTDRAAVTNCYRLDSYPLFQNKAAGSAVNCYTQGNLANQVGSTATFTNCYQGYSTTSVAGIEVMNEAAFTGGEVAYRLAKGDPQWGQTLSGNDKNNSPIYGGKAVYYSATANVGYHNHGDDGSCQYCNSQPQQDNNGWYIIRVRHCPPHLLHGCRNQTVKHDKRN